MTRPRFLGSLTGGAEGWLQSVWRRILCACDGGRELLGPDDLVLRGVKPCARPTDVTAVCLRGRPHGRPTCRQGPEALGDSALKLLRIKAWPILCGRDAELSGGQRRSPKGGIFRAAIRIDLQIVVLPPRQHDHLHNSRAKAGTLTCCRSPRKPVAFYGHPCPKSICLPGRFDRCNASNLGLPVGIRRRVTRSTRRRIPARHPAPFSRCPRRSIVP